MYPVSGKAPVGEEEVERREGGPQELEDEGKAVERRRAAGQRRGGGSQGMVK